SVNGDAIFRLERGWQGTQLPNFECKESRFKARVDFSGSEVKKLYLFAVEISGNAEFNELEASDLYIGNVLFAGDTAFEHAKCDLVEFRGAAFKGVASFLEAEFRRVS